MTFFIFSHLWVNQSTPYEPNKIINSAKDLNLKSRNLVVSHLSLGRDIALFSSIERIACDAAKVGFATVLLFFPSNKLPLVAVTLAVCSL